MAGNTLHRKSCHPSKIVMIEKHTVAEHIFENFQELGYMTFVGAAECSLDFDR
jgi:hypothetical protein